MKAIKKTGLVPVRALVRCGQNPIGSVFGLRPERARKGLIEGEVSLVPIPANVPTIDVEDPVIPVKPAAAEPVKAKIEIPNDWETMADLRLIAIAKQIGGFNEGERLTIDDARALIKQELEARVPA